MYNLLFLGAIVSLLLATITYSKRKSNNSDKFLAYYLVILGLHILLNFLENYNAKNNYRYTFLIMISPPLSLLHGPFYFFYLKSFYRPVEIFQAKSIVHFFPFVLFLINLCLTTYSLTAEEKIEMITTEHFTSWISFRVFNSLIMLSAIFYVSYCLYLLKKHKKRTMKNYSYLKGIELKWLKLFINGLLVLTILIIIIQIVSLTVNSFTFQQQNTLIFTLLSLFVVYLGYFGIKETNVFTKVYFVNTDLQTHTSKTQYTVDKDQYLYDNLIEVIQNKRIYTNPTLSIKKLSNEVRIPSDEISRLIHKFSNKNFFDFINYFRVEKFKYHCRLNPQPSKISIASLAYECGFNSKTTFNRAFKKMENQTPSDFIAELDTA